MAFLENTLLLRNPAGKKLVWDYMQVVMIELGMEVTPGIECSRFFLQFFRITQAFPVTSCCVA